jgi:hypothetical protein
MVNQQFLSNSIPNQQKLGNYENGRLVYPSNPLGIILNPSGEASVIAGSFFELSVTVSNRGQISAIIDVFIEDSSNTIRDWCLSPYERLGLNCGQSSEVIFQFQVPAEIPAGIYYFSLVIDSQQHYPEETPIHHPVRLQVLPFVQEVRSVSEPTFAILPLTNSANPALLPPGQPFELQVLVDNRSDRVDRFYLTCPDLENQWFTIIYPQRLTQGGIITSTEGLELNPGEKETIILRIHPPLNAPAGIYAPTLRLNSANHLDLVLLEVIYLQILPNYLLNIEFITLVGKIKNEAGLFELQFSNLGNTSREVFLTVRSAESADLCTYTLIPDRVFLFPGESTVVGLRVELKKPWQRPFYGRPLNFIVELTDAQNLPLIHDRFQGILLWEPRPWWQFLLLMFLILGTIGLLILLIWWLLTKPPIRPRILEFLAQSSAYQEVDGDAIRLNWKLSNPSKIETLKLSGLSPEGVVTSGPFIYDFRQGMPTELKPFCQIQTVLICQNVWTDAKKAGNYVFELTVIPKNSKGEDAEIAKTQTIPIDAIPQPKITELTSTQAIYQQVNLQSTVPVASNLAQTSNLPPPKPNSILLNWKIINSRPIQRLTLVGLGTDNSLKTELKQYNFTQGIPEALKPFCSINNQKTLSCEAVPTGVNTAGDYIFELSVISQNSQEAVSQLKTNVIKIEPAPLPQILEFASTQPTYQEAINPNSLNNRIILNWKLSNATQIQTLNLIGRTPDNSVASPLKTYNFAQGIPTPLQPFCQINQDELSCNNFLTDITTAGEYIFELTVIPKSEIPLNQSISQKTEKIKMTPQIIPAKIIKFNINGKPALPKYLVNLANPTTFINLDWKVAGSKNIKVELLPSPGTILPEGKVAYPISQKPGIETLILKVTDEQGQEIERSVVIETFLPTPDSNNTKAGENGASQDGTLLPVPAVPGMPGAADGQQNNGTENNQNSTAGTSNNQDSNKPLDPPDADSLEPAEIAPVFN